MTLALVVSTTKNMLLGPNSTARGRVGKLQHYASYLQGLGYKVCVLGIQTVRLLGRTRVLRLLGVQGMLAALDGDEIGMKTR